MSPTPAELDELLDRQAIADVLARYCRTLDEYDLDAMAATFTEDAVTDYGEGRGGRVEGRGAIRARIAAGQAEFRRTAHVLGQSLVEIEGHRAEGITYVTAWHEWPDGRQDALRLRYVDVFRRDEGRRWLIAERRVEAMGVEGFEGTDWNWVTRSAPEA
ncbi:MAG: nuclear transport factor 2 family protein [Actinomycetota bacterium]